MSRDPPNVDPFQTQWTCRSSPWCITKFQVVGRMIINVFIIISTFIINAIIIILLKLLTQPVIIYRNYHIYRIYNLQGIDFQSLANCTQKYD